MGAFAQILILLAFMAAGALVHRVRLSPPARVTDLLIKLVLWALLFVMGFRLGNARELRDRLGEIGLLAGGTAVASLAGTIAAIRAAYALLDALRARRFGHRAGATGARPEGGSGPTADAAPRRAGSISRGRRSCSSSSSSDSWPGWPCLSWRSTTAR